MQARNHGGIPGLALAVPEGMKRILFALAMFAAPLSAHATDAALGVSASSDSVQVQGDFDLDRQFGLQAGIGEMLFLDDLSLSAGGRYYFVPKKVSPYVGGIYRSFERRYHDHYVYGDGHYSYRESLVGPTLGLRARKWDGIGAFAQIELLTHVGRDGDGYRDHHDDDDSHFHTGLALGVQWWF